MKLFSTIILFFLSMISFAGEFEFGRTITISKPFYGDLYLSGGTIIINAPVYGDLVIAGGTIQINDTVTDDILIAGGTIDFKGFVGDDIRCAGGNITISGKIAGDVIVAGGEVKIEKSADMESLVITGGDILFEGTVRKSVKSIAGNFVLNGSVLENVDLQGGRMIINGSIGRKATLAASSDIVVGPGAHFGRSIHYWMPLNKRLQLPPGVADQQAIYDPLLSITYSRWYFLGASTLLGLLWYLGMALLMIAFIQFLFSSTFAKAGGTFHLKPFRAGGYGLLYFAGVPVAAVILMITIVGVPLGLIIALSYFILIILATVISSVVITNWAAYISNKTWSYWRTVLLALFTFVLLKIISFTPFFGKVLMFVIAAIAFGAILMNIKWKKGPGKPLEHQMNYPASEMHAS